MMREEFRLKYEKILAELKEKNEQVSALSSSNYSLTSELQETVNDIKLLSDSYEIIKEENARLKCMEKALHREADELLADNREVVDEYQRCVATIEKLLECLSEEKAASSEKDALLKELSDSNSYFEIHLNHCAKEIEKYEKTIYEINSSEKKYLCEANNLDLLRVDHELVINRLQWENLEIREVLDREAKNSDQVEEVIQQMRERCIGLEKKVLGYE